jgi:oligopeptide/dipeptide ABC transporter ATP-binding protein
MKSLRKVGQIIFQDPFSSLNPRMKIGDIIAEPLRIHSYGNKAAIHERVEYLVNRVGLSKDIIGSYPHELDGGRCQRVGVARAIAMSPSFVVCDEPVSALDVSVQAQVLNLLEDLCEEFNLTYLFISHDLSVVRRISHRIVVLYLGKIMEMATANELFENPLHPYTKALLSAVPTLNIDNRRERIILKGDVPTPINLGEGCRFSSRCEHCMERCTEETPKLLDRGTGHYVACHM